MENTEMLEIGLLKLAAAAQALSDQETPTPDMARPLLSRDRASDYSIPTLPSGTGLSEMSGHTHPVKDVLRRLGAAQRTRLQADIASRPAVETQGLRTYADELLKPKHSPTGMIRQPLTGLRNLISTPPGIRERQYADYLKAHGGSPGRDPNRVGSGPWDTGRNAIRQYDALRRERGMTDSLRAMPDNSRPFVKNLIDRGIIMARSGRPSGGLA